MYTSIALSTGTVQWHCVGNLIRLEVMKCIYRWSRLLLPIPRRMELGMILQYSILCRLSPGIEGFVSEYRVWYTIKRKMKLHTVYLCIYVFMHLRTYASTYLRIYASTHLRTYASTYLCIVTLLYENLCKPCLAVGNKLPVCPQSIFFHSKMDKCKLHIHVYWASIHVA